MKVSFAMASEHARCRGATAPTSTNITVFSSSIKDIQKHHTGASTPTYNKVIINSPDLCFSHYIQISTSPFMITSRICQLFIVLFVAVSFSRHQSTCTFPRSTLIHYLFVALQFASLGSNVTTTNFTRKRKSKDDSGLSRRSAACQIFNSYMFQVFCNYTVVSLCLSKFLSLCNARGEIC